MIIDVLRIVISPMVARPVSKAGHSDGDSRNRVGFSVKGCMIISPRRIFRVLSIAFLAACGGGDGGNEVVTPLPPPQPSDPPADVAGTWVFTESFATATQENPCSDRGLHIFAGSGTSLAGTVRQVGTCILSGSRRTNAGRADLQDLSAVGDSIRFGYRHPQTSITCSYRGKLSGVPVATVNGIVSCTNGTSGTWQATRGNPVIPALGTIAWIETGDLTSCAANTAGQMFCWGINTFAQLATGDDVGRFVPVPAASGMSFTTVSLSPAGAFGCGLTADGRAYCWGNTHGGRLGISAPSSNDVETSPRPVTGDRRFKSIAAGGDHTCGVALDGAAYCWGNNARGQLGTGDNSGSSIPVLVKGGLTFASISAHILATCGVTTDGEGYCWGDNRSGVLGNGTTTDSRTPVRVADNHRFSSITMGMWIACGLAMTGEAYCWGDNFYGQLGLGSTGGGLRLTPQPVTGNISWRLIDAGVGVVCGVSTSNLGYCWGDNEWGQLGNGTELNASAPRAIAGNLALRTISADWHVCALDMQATAYCWGAGREGSVGDGRLQDVSLPVKVGQ